MYTNNADWNGGYAWNLKTNDDFTGTFLYMGDDELIVIVREIDVDGSIIENDEVINLVIGAFTGIFPNVPNNMDSSGQGFGIDSISMTVNAIGLPKVSINFVDVRGKTLMSGEQNSPYASFFHLPWPIFYLTINTILFIQVLWGKNKTPMNY